MKIDIKEKIKEFFTNAIESIAKVAMILLLIISVGFMRHATIQLNDMDIRLSNGYDSTIETGLTITEKEEDKYTVYIDENKKSNFDVFAVDKNKYYIYTDKKAKKIYLMEKGFFEQLFFLGNIIIMIIGG